MKLADFTALRCILLRSPRFCAACLFFRVYLLIDGITNWHGSTGYYTHTHTHNISLSLFLSHSLTLLYLPHTVYQNIEEPVCSFEQWSIVLYFASFWIEAKINLMVLLLLISYLIVTLCPVFVNKTAVFFEEVLMKLSTDTHTHTHNEFSRVIVKKNSFTVYNVVLVIILLAIL